MAGIGKQEPLCSIYTGTYLSGAAMARAIKGAARDLGEDPEHYDTHSMRSGGATALFAAGIDRLAIKHFGRWNSDCFEQYARIDDTTVSSLAAAMASTTQAQSTNRSARLRL